MGIHSDYQPVQSLGPLTSKYLVIIGHISCCFPNNTGECHIWLSELLFIDFLQCWLHIMIRFSFVFHSEVVSTNSLTATFHHSCLIAWYFPSDGFLLLIGPKIQQSRTVFIAYGPSFLLGITLMGSKALVQLARISNSMFTFRSPLITSSATHDKDFYFFSFSSVSTSQKSTGSSSFVYVSGKLIPSWFKLNWLETLKPSNEKDVWFSFPVEVLTVMDAFWTIICRIFKTLASVNLCCNYPTLQMCYKQNWNLYVFP